MQTAAVMHRACGSCPTQDFRASSPTTPPYPRSSLSRSRVGWRPAAHAPLHLRQAPKTQEHRCGKTERGPRRSKQENKQDVQSSLIRGASPTRVATLLFGRRSPGASRDPIASRRGGEWGDSLHGANATARPRAVYFEAHPALWAHRGSMWARPRSIVCSSHQLFGGQPSCGHRTSVC